MSADEHRALYDCLKPQLVKSYKGGAHWAVAKWGKWANFAKHGYRSDTHGGRFVQNYANKIAKANYGKYDGVTSMPIGSTLAKPSYTVGKNGQATMGPLFIMEKMTKGWNPDTADWRYAMVMPAGGTFGVTKGKNSSGMTFCHECHAAGEANDFMLFLPEEYRK